MHRPARALGAGRTSQLDLSGSASARGACPSGDRGDEELGLQGDAVCHGLSLTAIGANEQRNLYGPMDVRASTVRTSSVHHVDVSSPSNGRQDFRLGCGMCPRLETARLVLRAHAQEDFPALAEMWASPEVVRHISGSPSTPGESWSRLLRYRGLWGVLGYGYWCVCERATGRYVGDVGFADFRRETRPSIAGVPEAGWVLSPWAHGQGFGGEAVTAALDWLDREILPDRIVCLISDGNVASIRLAMRNGFAAAGRVMLAAEEVPLWSRDKTSP